MIDLLVDWVAHDAAKYAVEHWHYSHILPTGKLVKIGAWEDGTFIGVVIFSRGASPWLGKAYNLDATQICELTRVALTTHAHPVSEIVAAAIRLLRSSNPGLRLVVSFADPNEGHHGGIYQAGNWIYTGESNPVIEHYIGGRWRHTRGAYWQSKGTTVPTRETPGKHRYLYPLDRAIRRRVQTLAVAFPAPIAPNARTKAQR